jgi:histone H4
MKEDEVKATAAVAESINKEMELEEPKPKTKSEKKRKTVSLQDDIAQLKSDIATSNPYQTPVKQPQLKKEAIAVPIPMDTTTTTTTSELITPPVPEAAVAPMDTTTTPAKAAAEVKAPQIKRKQAAPKRKILAPAPVASNVPLPVSAFSAAVDQVVKIFKPDARKKKGETGAKRHRRKVLQDNIQGITKPAIRRLARRGGVKRISGGVYDETRGVLKIFLAQIVKDAVCYTEHAKRKTVTAMDVVFSLKRNGYNLYGFGG